MIFFDTRLILSEAVVLSAVVARQAKPMRKNDAYIYSEKTLR